MIIRPAIHSTRDSESSGATYLRPSKDPFNLLKGGPMTLDNLIDTAHKKGFTSEDVEQAMQLVIDDDGYWDNRGPEALLQAIRRLREGPLLKEPYTRKA